MTRNARNLLAHDTSMKTFALFLCLLFTTAFSFGSNTLRVWKLNTEES